MEHKSRAVILRVIDFGEADRLVTFFTEDFGKIKGVAKHAKKSKKRFGAGLEPGAIGSVKFVEKQNVELTRLDEFIVLHPAWKVTGSLEKIMSLYVSLEMADKMLPLGHASATRFGLIERWISFLSDNEPDPSHSHAFIYKWLTASGLEPVLDRCVSCGGEIDGGAFSDQAYGGLICRKCHRGKNHSLEISGDMLKYLLGFKNGKILGKTFKAADKVFENLLIHAIGGELKTLRVAAEVNSATTK